MYISPVGSPSPVGETPSDVVVEVVVVEWVAVEMVDIEPRQYFRVLSDAAQCAELQETTSPFDRVLVIGPTLSSVYMGGRVVQAQGW